ncbi:serine protease [Marinomonas sp. 15G1-11]|uniref:Serine protease n=1 Tax=Marinomonas phaeophyticola TaxID=3004091 RepID=A0ABT4JX98_9GAMM|nr:ABC-three component system protein [Marinomonas sp. 15G1-11]MCZ2722418.1 serine protease [Marinomonas sp. 15G1-11]
MANPQDIIRKNTVVVDDGSGVILQPMTQEYSYVVTAKHVIQVDKNDISKGFKSKNDIEIYSTDDIKITLIDFYYHSDFDLALLKIEYLGSDILTKHNTCQFDERLQLWGFPKFSANHRNEEKPRKDWIENYAATVCSVSPDKLECRPDGNVEITGLEGFSGGGLFDVADNKIYLAAIEYRVHNPDTYVNRICSVPIQNLQKILDENNLLPICPPYLGSLSELKSEAFQSLSFFNPKTKEKLAKLFTHLSKDKIEQASFTPYSLINTNKKLINELNNEPKSIEDEELWVSILEFLQVHELLNPQFQWDENFVNYLTQNFKFLYFIDESWKNKLKDIVLFDCGDLVNQGYLILIHNGAERPDEPDQLNQYRDHEKLPRFISDGLDDPDSIAHIHSKKSKNISILHMAKLNRYSLSDKEADFDNLTFAHLDQMKNQLIDSYSKYLSCGEKK